jgi:uncharacterized protein YeaO (DUF488 family)
VRRVYEEAEDEDGIRVLVDRIWPRGMTKEKAALDEWCKDVAPSTELRKWYAHDPAKFPEFTRRYRAELEHPERSTALHHLRDLAAGGQLTLLTGTKAADISEAAVLADVLGG